MSIAKRVIAIAMILAFAISTFEVAISTAQTSDLPTWLFLRVAPNPIGVGQSAYVNTFMSKPAPTTLEWFGDYYKGITVEITAPNGNKQTIGPLTADAAGGTYTTFTPDIIGNYTFQAVYPGQTLTGTNDNYPNDVSFWNSNLIGSKMLPSNSEKITLVVQEEQIPSYSTAPLPTEYWSRPIHALNWDWANTYGGNWLGLAAGDAGWGVSGHYDATGDFQPYTTAPKTGHVLWTKPTAFGGQVGGPISADQTNSYQSVEPNNAYFEPIIINGVLFHELDAEYAYYKQGWTAVDLRTGKELWTKPCGVTGREWLKCGQVLAWHTIGWFGSRAFLWSIEGTESVSLISFPVGNLTLRIYEPLTLTLLATIINAHNINMVSDVNCTEQGTLLGWYIEDNNLILWNSTRAIAYPTGDFSAPSSRYVPDGVIEWSAGIQWSKPLPTAVDNTTIGWSIAKVSPEVILLHYAPEISFLYSAGYIVKAGIDARAGNLMWGPINQTVPQYESVGIGDPAEYLMLGGAKDGVYIMMNKDTWQFWGYSLLTGKELWGPVHPPSNALSPMAPGMDIAYGKLFLWDFGGFVHALDLKTGAILWTLYPRDTGFETVSEWPFAGSICDGMLFLGEGSLYNPPLNPGSLTRAINCTTGEVVWSELSFGARMVAAFADGMMVRWNSYDKQIYTYGKGQTATTVSIQNDVITHGNSVLAKGFVTDESPGTKDSDRLARFPNGVPAVADEIMSPWMEYVYQQQPKPADVSGVEVVLTVLDPNNNYYDVAKTTSDEKGMYKVSFEPEVPGEYTVIASFAGSESYWPSQAVTAINVVETVSASTPEPTQAPQSMADLYFLPVSIGMIIAIVAVLVMMILMFRKR